MLYFALAILGISTEGKMRRRSSLKIKNGMGMLQLAVWLILSGVTVFVPAARQFNEFAPFLALAAGILILMDK